MHRKREYVRGHFSRGMIDSVVWEFDGYKDGDNDAVTLCEEFLNLMKKFVNHLKIELP